MILSCTLQGITVNRNISLGNGTPLVLFFGKPSGLGLLE